ncbi:hypothetical protein [Ruegeria sp. HKCCD8929]|uniref:hypothetical protein n=1 Tax=Ruegeria sp. HKCCD8929 TaxID=2683006 RepID=UPI0014891A3F|nr:hypothetical protein [Ruegeria sp. HKCCD8929]
MPNQAAIVFPILVMLSSQPTQAEAIDPCALLTLQDAEQHLGAAVDGPLNTPDSYCGYSNAAYQSVAVSIENASAYADGNAQDLADKLNEIQRASSFTADFPPWQVVDIQGYLAVGQELSNMASVRVVHGEVGLLVVAPTLDVAIELARELASRVP